MKFLKWFGIAIALMMMVALSPLLLPASALAWWYFAKRKPNERFSKYAKYVFIVSAIGLPIVSATDTSSHEEVQVVEEVSITKTVEEVDSEVDVISEKERLEAERIRKEKEEEAEKAAEKKKQEEALAELNPNKSGETEAPTVVTKVKAGEVDAKVNDNTPFFSNEDVTSLEVYHQNGPLDHLNRVTAANALLGVEIMPAHERGSIGHHEPTGWSQASYANIGSGGWLYNRSHLIGFQLTGNDDYENLMTGTRQFNMQMLEYENFVANYIESTENHVRYRVTPVYEGNNLVASGVYMEGFSIEDNGQGLMFNVFVPNVQDGVTINYANGSSVGPEGPSREGEIPQISAPKQQAPAPAPAPAPVAPAPAPAPAPVPQAVGDNLSAVDTNGNGKVTIKEAKAAGYQMPIYSDHWLYKYMDDRNNNGMVGE